MIIISAQFITTFLLCMYPVNVTFRLLVFFPWTQCHQMKVLLFSFFSSLKRGKPPHPTLWIQNCWRMTEGCSSCSFSHRNNKWSYSARMGERINQQRCCFVWNATINHRGLMSGRGKGHWRRELWGEDAPFVVIYYSESTHQLDLWFTQS